MPACAGWTVGSYFSAMIKQPCVYIITNYRYGTLYIGVTSDLAHRMWQHRIGEFDGFSKRYGLKLLVWYEIYDEMVPAIVREKQIKKWNRGWKIELIEKMNRMTVSCHLGGRTFIYSGEWWWGERYLVYVDSRSGHIRGVAPG
jgi:putative endonuclease